MPESKIEFSPSWPC